MTDNEIVRQVFAHWIATDKLQNELTAEGEAAYTARDTTRQAQMEALTAHITEARKHVTAALSITSTL